MHGDPHPSINVEHRVRRDIAEMIGLARGVLADGTVSEDEAMALMTWVDDHSDVTLAFPGNVIYRRLRTIFSDGHASTEECEDLRGLLNELLGGDGGTVGGETASTGLPLDHPPPPMEVTNRVFVLTGRFAYGTRGACEEAIRSIGGWCEKSVTKHTDYLVIGAFASRDWIQTPYGTKIVKAQEYRDRFGIPTIIAEEHWVANL
jgi:hypothetical protein